MMNIQQQQASTMAQLQQQFQEFQNFLQQNPGNQQPGRQSMKLNTPDSFRGGYKDNIRTWLFDVNSYFRAQRHVPSDEEKIRYAILLLKGAAKAWWQEQEARAAREASTLKMPSMTGRPLRPESLSASSPSTTRK